jgi:iron complex outermembrane receptor protein
VPEALRLVPGLQVARINANTWAISARGFNERFANKLLVLVDGRTVYSPLFSGVFWDTQTLPLGEIDRIEVIRGPGATMWGANAVNGVINIITRNSAATPGGAVQMVTGTRNRAAGAFRYGGPVGARGHLRVNLAGFAADAFDGIDGSPAHDQWNIGEGSFRSDLDLGSSRTLLVEGGYQRAGMDGLWRQFTLDPPAVVDTKLDQDYRGAHLLARLEHSRDDGPSSSLQAFYDRTDRNLAPVLRDRRTTWTACTACPSVSAL